MQSMTMARLLVKATPTSTADDYAVFVYDTDDDTNLAFHSAKGNTEYLHEDGATKQTEGIADLSSTEAIKASWESKAVVFSIRVDGDNVEGYLNGVKVASHGQGLGIEGGTKLQPWVFAQSRLVTTTRDLILHNWSVVQRTYA